MTKKNKEIFEAISLLEKERGISADFMFDKIKKAILTACKNSYNGNEDAIIAIDDKKGIFEVYLRKTVVDDVKDKGKEISLLNARVIDKNVIIGDKVSVKLDTREFGRIAAQTARNIIRQGIRDGERNQVMQEFTDKQHQIVSAVIEKIDIRTGAATLRIGKAETVLPKSEQICSESLKEGDRIKVYVVDVKETEKGPKIIISRTHSDLVRRLFENEVPEIHDGIIEIKAISREAGSRTKMAVLSNDKDIDPIGSCIGAKGARVGAIIDELCGEKIDIIEYSENPSDFIKAALSPAEVIDVRVDTNVEHACIVIVPESQLSLAIGNKGQNVRLAARLTGYKIDIKTPNDLENDLADN